MSKRIIYFVACLDIVLIALAFVFGFAVNVAFNANVAHSAIGIYEWYYKPRTDGKQPEKNTEMEFIYSYDAFGIGNPDEKIIYLTFDAGFENGYMDSILDTLLRHDVPAAFFVVGSYIETNPALINRMVDEGHLVCNHSTNHKQMAKITNFEEYKKELLDIEDTFYETAGKSMSKFFRPPEGAFSELSLEYAKNLGYTTIFWSFAYCDWLVDDQPTKEFAMSKIIPRTHPGEIALLHSTSKTNANILDEVIVQWKSMGYSFKSLDYLKDTYSTNQGEYE